VGPTPDLSHESRSLAFCRRGASQGDADLYVMLNTYWEPLAFAIQEGVGEWSRAIDTSLSSPEDLCEPGREVPLTSSTYAVGPRSVVVLVGR
jgi:glycogen operon protein